MSNYPCCMTARLGKNTRLLQKAGRCRRSTLKADQLGLIVHFLCLASQIHYITGFQSTRTNNRTHTSSFLFNNTLKVINMHPGLLPPHTALCLHCSATALSLTPPSFRDGTILLLLFSFPESKIPRSHLYYIPTSNIFFFSLDISPNT